MANTVIIVSAMMAVVFSPVLAIVGQGRPDIGDVALVLVLPWDSPAHLVANAAGTVEVTPERAPIGALVSLEDEGSLDRLYANGARLVVKGQKVLELCSS